VPDEGVEPTRGVSLTGFQILVPGWAKLRSCERSGRGPLLQDRWYVRSSPGVGGPGPLASRRLHPPLVDASTHRQRLCGYVILSEADLAEGVRKTRGP